MTSDTSIKELARTVDNLARMTAEGFADVTTRMATKQEMQSGFSVVMEALNPMRRDYEALKDDLAPQVANLDARLTRVERKVGT